ncbi:MAG: sugar phosphate isomerase/epimerase [Christensenellaceae bacterium]|nr:sugar phosphate isomerase/epimerase [Christensenellaceae bacterium]
MNIGIRLHDTLPGTLAERLTYAREQGFSCAHLALSKAVSGFSMDDAPRLLNEELAASVRGDFAAQGMECVVLGCYLNLADPDPERRKRTQEIYRAHLRFSRMMGARVVGTETPANKESRFDQPAPESEEAFRLFMDGLKPVVRFAEEEGAILAVEPVATHIVSTPERAERMLNELPSDNLQIILDAVNLLSPENEGRAQEVIGEAIRRWGDRVRVLHMKDYNLISGKVKSGACGTGKLRYESLLTLAKERDLPMTLEDTIPDNAEQARLHLENIASQIK